MRISDWSSDVCSSDLSPGRATGVVVAKIGSADAPAAERLVGGQRGCHRLFVDCRRHFGRQHVDGGDLGVVRVLGVVVVEPFADRPNLRSEEHPSELQSLMRISYAVFCLKKKNIKCIRMYA